MGTSKGYGMPTGGDWTPLKKEATNFVKTQGQGATSAQQVLSSYLKASGGSQAFARGQTGGAGGRGQGNGTAARTLGQNLGGFLASVGDLGLNESLKQIGLGNLIGKPATEVTMGLLDALATPANTLDEQAARGALIKLNEDLLKDAQTCEDVERFLLKALDEQGLANIISSFFGHYLYEIFCRDFYEQWVKKAGIEKANQSLKSIKDYIKWELKSKLLDKNVVGIDWKGAEGLEIIAEVMQETLEIFEV